MKIQQPTLPIQSLRNAGKVLLALAAVLLSVTSCRNDDSTPDQPVRVTTQPSDPGQTLLSLFTRYRFVALGELHYNQEIWDLVDDLVRQPGFADRVSTVGFEGGNSAYQDLMDRYVNGEAVTEAEIKKVWRNNTQNTTTFDAPVYLRFLNRIRDLNQRLPAAKKVRVLLMDPPIDWQTVKSRADRDKFALQRQDNMEKVIEAEVYQQNKTLLYVAGPVHIDRNQSNPLIKNPLVRLEAKYPGTTFSATTYSGFGLNEQRLGEVEAQFAAWPKPGIALLKDTWVGELEGGINSRIKNADGTITNPYPGLKMQDIHDAILFLGNRSQLTLSDPSKGVCTGKPEDQAWIDELLRRQEVIETPPFLRKTKEDLCKPYPLHYFDQDIYK